MMVEMGNCKYIADDTSGHSWIINFSCELAQKSKGWNSCFSRVCYVVRWSRDHPCCACDFVCGVPCKRKRSSADGRACSRSAPHSRDPLCPQQSLRQVTRDCPLTPWRALLLPSRVCNTQPCCRDLRTPTLIRQRKKPTLLPRVLKAIGIPLGKPGANTAVGVWQIHVREN